MRQPPQGRGAERDPDRGAPARPRAARRLTVSEDDAGKVAAAARALAPSSGVVGDDDLVTSLLLTVLDYQMRTEVVARALARYRERHADEVRALADLERLLAGFPDDPDGNRALARALWGYDLWTRAGQLRGLVRLFRDAGVHDEETLRAWARTSSFERDFQGRVKGLGRTVYHSLVMRQGVDTVKPDVHVRRFAEAALGRSLADRDVVEVTTRAAARLGIAAAELDLRIWEASRGAPGY